MEIFTSTETMVLRLFDLKWFIVWSIKDVRHRDTKDTNTHFFFNQNWPAMNLLSNHMTSVKKSVLPYLSELLDCESRPYQKCPLLHNFDNWLNFQLSTGMENNWTGGKPVQGSRENIWLTWVELGTYEYPASPCKPLKVLTT